MTCVHIQLKSGMHEGILSNRPAFRGTVLNFSSKFTAVPLFLHFVLLSVLYFLCTSLPLNLIILTVFIEFLRMSRF